MRAKVKVFSCCLIATTISCAAAQLAKTHKASAQEKTSTGAGIKPVTSGSVIRGLTLGGTRGAPGSPTGRSCDFGQESIGPDGRMLGASVNCRPGGDRANTIVGLPVRFDAYCAIDAPVKSARLIQAPQPDNNNHCDLSGITPKDATGQFQGAVWR